MSLFDTKRAVLSAAAFYVNCPTCKEGVTHPGTGSYLWEAHDTVQGNDQQPTRTKCACGQNVVVVMPKRVTT